MDLGDFDSPEALNALLSAASDPHEHEIIQASAGESLARIWLRNGLFDGSVMSRLSSPARAEAAAAIQSERPEWLARGD